MYRVTVSVSIHVEYKGDVMVIHTLGVHEEGFLSGYLDDVISFELRKMYIVWYLLGES